MSSGFISEAEIEEKRRLRQEEWEKVRKPDEPLEAPEEEYDPRSLYEKLQEQKQKKDIEYEEAHKLKNMIKGLDDDEVDFLDLVDRSKMEAERRKFAEEAQEMQDFRSAVASLQERSLQERINNEVRRQPPVSSAAGSSGSKSSQHRLLSGAVKRKTAEPSNTQDTKKAHTSGDISGEPQTTETEDGNIPKANGNISDTVKRKRIEGENGAEEVEEFGKQQGALKCIGVLPGMGHYHDSSDSEHSSNTDEELNTASGFDLCGRKLGKKMKLQR